MPDCSAIDVTIGGTLDRSLLDEFTEVAEGCLNGVDDLEDGKPLLLEDDEASWGASQAEPLTEWCRGHGLAYVLHDHGHYTWTPTVRYWEPGLDAERVWVADVDVPLPHLSVEEIASLLASSHLQPEIELMRKARHFDRPLVLAGEEPDA